MAYKDHIVHIKGNAKNPIFLFALSTCGWCAKTKNLFNELKLDYQYVDVDLLEDSDQAEVEKELEKYKTDFAFPKIIIKGKVISGFNEEEIRNALK